MKVTSVNTRILAKVLNFIGISLMIAVIVIMIPLSVPKLFGIQIFSVLSGSMEPAYPVGGVVYVKQVVPSTLQIGDVITYNLGTNTEYVMTHRIVELNSDAETFLTKGDANEGIDAEPVSYTRVVGKVVLYLPFIAKMADFTNTTVGIALLFCIFASSLIFWLVADIVGKRNRNTTTINIEEIESKMNKKNKNEIEKI